MSHKNKNMNQNNRMDQMTYDTHKRINLLVDVLEDARMSSENHDSSQEPCFMLGPTHAFKQDFKRLPELPEGLNRNFKYLYDIIGNPSVEVTLIQPTEDDYAQEWTIMSLKKSLEVYQEYCKEGQKRVFDVAFMYMGMGHINVLSCDLETHNLFIHRAGGSSGWDREIHFQDVIKTNPYSYDQFFFLPWFLKFLNKD